MADITVGDVPDETYAELEKRATRAGLSLEDFVRCHVLEWAKHSEQQPSTNAGPQASSVKVGEWRSCG